MYESMQDCLGWDYKKKTKQNIPVLKVSVSCLELINIHNLLVNHYEELAPFKRRKKAHVQLYL